MFVKIFCCDKGALAESAEADNQNIIQRVTPADLALSDDEDNGGGGDQGNAQRPTTPPDEYENLAAAGAQHQSPRPPPNERTSLLSEENNNDATCGNGGEIPVTRVNVSKSPREARTQQKTTTTRIPSAPAAPRRVNLFDRGVPYGMAEGEPRDSALGGAGAGKTGCRPAARFREKSAKTG